MTYNHKKTSLPVPTILDKYIVPILITCSIAGALAVSIHIIQFEKKLVKTMALESVETLSKTLMEFRTLYTSEVVNSAEKAGVEITHDYADKEHAIPLPATFSMLLGNEVSKHLDGGKTRLYSPYPFPWRKDEGGIKDKFGKDAWKALTQDPSTPYYRIEKNNGKQFIRYATADVMRHQCINCHNTHPNTPKNDWKVGDVPGILEITKPLDKAIALTKASMEKTLFLLFIFSVSGIVLFSFVMKSLQARAKKALSAEIEVTAKIKETQRLNKQMKKYTDKLEEARLEQKTKELALRHAKEEADQANVAKSEFLANMSHELRTPLSSIIGMAEMILNSDLDADQRENTEIIQSSGESLLSTLNDVLDISKIEAGELKIEHIPFDVDLCIQQAVQILHPLAIEKGLKLRIKNVGTPPLIMVGDLNKVQQILRNLMGNALKFTEKGSVTVIREVVTSGNTACLYLAIEDTGIGIAPNKLNTIFEKFTQADASVTRKFGGTGLGLAITQKLCNIMGGKVGVESVKGWGSTFWCNIPLVVASESVKPVNICEEKHSFPDIDVPKNIKILSVEDYPTNQMFIKKLLARLGFSNLDLADNGKDALSMIKKKQYDIILMDCQMPELDGYQTAKIIRKMEKGNKKHLTIIAITAHAMTGDREKCLQAGMDDYLSKPIRSEKLITLIKKHVAQSDQDLSSEKVLAEVPKENKEPPVDIKHLEIFTGGDPKEEKELFDLFIEQATFSLKEMEKTCAKEKNEAWRSQAHKIKGASTSLGANNLTALCSEAEEGYEMEEDEKKALLAGIYDEFLNVKSFLEKTQHH